MGRIHLRDACGKLMGKAELLLVVLNLALTVSLQIFGYKLAMEGFKGATYMLRSNSWPVEG